MDENDGSEISLDARRGTRPLLRLETLRTQQCASGSRSAQASKILKSAGFTDVTNAGGLGSMPR